MTRYGLENTEALRSTLKGRRVGLVTNPTGLDSCFRRSVDLVAEVAPVYCLFGPEHGVDGGAQAGDKVANHHDRRTGLPVYSLYGEHRRPTAEMLADLEVLVFDMQDVGLRWYTYPWTLSYVIEACLEAQLPLVVLDRPNPLGGATVEGLLLDDDCRSFVGRFPVVARHGLTLGELARHLVRVYFPGTDLSVIPCQNWDATQSWPLTGLPWVAPSPNLPTFESVQAYTATAFLEGTTLSEGRGTTRPFGQFGAPWLDHEALSTTMMNLSLPGLLWRPTFFTPTFSKFAGQVCRGVSLHVTNPEAPLFEAGVHLHHALMGLHPEYQPIPPWKEGSQPPLALLWGTRQILQPTNAQELLSRAQKDCLDWNAQRQPDLLYGR